MLVKAPSARADECGATAFDCALFYISRQDFRTAVRYAETEVKASPQNLKAINLLGIALTGAQRIEEANEKFRDALRVEPRFFPARKNLAINEFNAGRPSEAQSHFERVLEEAPGDEVAHLYLAEIHYEAQRFEPALRHYEKTGPRVAANSALLLHYAECLLELNQREKALSTLESVPRDDPAVLFHAGVLLGRFGAYAPAAKFFAQARPRYEDPYVAGYNEALMRMQSGENAAALRVARELLDQGHRSAELYSLISSVHLNEGRIQDAYETLRTATQLDPDNEDPYVELAGICLDYANYDLGLEIVDIGLRRVPNSYRLQLQRGVLLVMKGQVAQAQPAFVRASELAPKAALPYVAMGIALMQLGQAEKAVELLGERIRQYPDDYMLPYILGMALVRSGAEPGSAAETEAIEAFGISVRLNPEFPHSRGELGKMLLRRGDLDRAIQELETAVKLDPTEAAPAFQLAQAYRRKGMADRAKEMLAHVSRLHAKERDFEAGADLKRLMREGVARPSPRQTKP
jgi:tetratricopeptide (TPR) repeat protein